jgi:hypothetical protein
MTTTTTSTNSTQTHPQPDIAELLDQAQAGFIHELNSSVDELAGVLADAHEGAREWWAYRTSVGAANLAVTYVDTNAVAEYTGLARDSYHDGCDWYVTNVSSCGSFDDEDFAANDLCRACKTIPDPNWTCVDDAAARDAAGDDCSWYRANGQCGRWDTETFSAARDCCACADSEPVPVNLRGVKPKIPAVLAAAAPKAPMMLTAEKKAAMNLSASAQSLRTRLDKSHAILLLSTMEDTAMGAVDAYGDGCDWYGVSEARAENCGEFDDDDFNADQMCVACGGGRSTATDRAGDNCSWYAGRFDSCGMWDDEDF